MKDETTDRYSCLACGAAATIENILEASAMYEGVRAIQCTSCRAREVNGVGNGVSQGFSLRTKHVRETEKEDPMAKEIPKSKQCKNHPNKWAVSGNLCFACYTKEHGEVYRPKKKRPQRPKRIDDGHTTKRKWKKTPEQRKYESVAVSKEDIKNFERIKKLQMVIDSLKLILEDLTA